MSLRVNTRLGRVIAALSLALVVAACSSGQKDNIELQGQLTAANNGSLPDDASARISLVQQPSDNGERRIVAERTLHDLGKQPIQFDLNVGRGLLNKDAQYGLSAEILDSSGNVSWQTPVAQAVQPFAKDKTTTLLMLQKKMTDVTDNDVALISYVCADQFRFTASSDAKQAAVHLGHRQLSLQAKQTGKGQKTTSYVDDHGNSLRLKQKEIALTVDGTTHDDCQVAPEKDNIQSESSDSKSGADPADESEGTDAGTGKSSSDNDAQAPSTSEKSEPAHNSKDE